MKRLRVALLRGAYLGPFEAQNYEPLLDRFDLHGYILPQNPFALDGCRLPVTVCRFPDARWLGGRSLINAWRTRVRGERYPMPGVDKIVSRSDIVHTFEAWYTYTRQAAEACKRRGVPLVVTHWDTLPYARTIDAVTREKIAQTFQVASKILATTKTARQALLDEGVPADKIVVQGMGVDAERFCPGKRDTELAYRLGIEPNDFVFLFIGRLAVEKGIRELVLAFQALCRESGALALKLLLVGAGHEEEWVRSATKSWGLQGKVLVAPRVPYPDLHLWHRLADVFVFPSVPQPSVEEQFGYPLVEAMSSGRAVITTSVGGIPDVVGHAARLVPPRDVTALSRAMAQLWEDTAERARLADLARKRVLDQFSTRVVSENLSQIYREVCRS